MLKAKILSVVTALFLCVCLLAGCGAVITTNMTADENFIGERNIYATLTNSDISQYVNGGVGALETVIKGAIPPEMTYTITAEGDNTVIGFKITYNGIDDYRAKVAKIIAAGSNVELVPSVIYEKTDTVFKNGMKFSENFKSFDLLQWYYDALESSGIITTTYDWYENGSDKIVLEGVEYEATNHQFNVDNQERNCLDEGLVETVMNLDGSFKRTITLTASDDTVTALSGKGCELESYLRALLPDAESDTFEVIDSEDYDETYYIFTLSAASSEELITKTNQVFQTSNAKFSVEITARDDEIGMADMKITETIDGSYYFDYDDETPVKSILYLYDNAQLKTATDSEYQFEDEYRKQLSYYPNSNAAYEFDFDWKISFKTVELKIKASGIDSLNADLVFTLESSMQDSFKQNAISAVETAAQNNGEFSQTDDGCTVCFKGTIQEVTDAINRFIGAAASTSVDNGDEISTEDTASADEGDTESSDSVDSYFSVKITEFSTASRFTDGYSGEVEFDFTPVIGNTCLTLNDEEGLLADSYYVGSYIAEREDMRTVPSQSSMEFFNVNVSIIGVALPVIFALIFIVGAVMLLASRKDIKELIASAKTSKLQKAAAQSAYNVQAAQMMPEQFVPEQNVTLNEPVTESADISVLQNVQGQEQAEYSGVTQVLSGPEQTEAPQEASVLMPEPQAEQPVYEQPVYEQPVYEEQTYEQMPSGINESADVDDDEEELL